MIKSTLQCKHENEMKQCGSMAIMLFSALSLLSVFLVLCRVFLSPTQYVIVHYVPGGRCWVNNGISASCVVHKAWVTCWISPFMLCRDQMDQSRIYLFRASWSWSSLGDHCIWWYFYKSCSFYSKFWFKSCRALILICLIL